VVASTPARHAHAVIASKWPVVLTVPVDGELTDDVIDAMFAAARSAYFDLCTTVDPAQLTVGHRRARRGEATPGDTVTVSVNVVEIYPDSFTMRARIRPAAGDGVVADASCTLSVDGTVSEKMRDEFIGLAQNARFMH
jgi:hypothetical protein